jgi:hypothetical protein
VMSVGSNPSTRISGGGRKIAFWRLYKRGCVRVDPLGSLKSYGRYRIDSGSCADRMRTAPTLIAVHRWRVGGTTKAICIFNSQTPLPHRQYIRISPSHNPISEITPFGPLYKIPKSFLKRSFLYRQSIYAIFTT